jgi:allophanate hydrolase
MNRIMVSREMGTFTNLLDLAAVAVPAGDADGGHLGISLIGPAFSDGVLGDLAARVCGEPTGGVPEPGGVDLFVIGAHRRGQPLHHELVVRGARGAGNAHTAEEYRLHALATEPAKPGLVRVGEDTGAAIEGELWTLPVTALGSFLAALPPPMTLGSVLLADGRRVVGFGCEPAALAGAPDITADGSWPAYLARVRGGG